MPRNRTMFEDTKDVLKLFERPSINQSRWDRITKMFYDELKTVPGVEVEYTIQFESPKYIVSIDWENDVPVFVIEPITRVYLHITRKGEIYIYRDVPKGTRLMDPLELSFIHKDVDRHLATFIKSKLGKVQEVLKILTKKQFIADMRRDR